MEQVTELKELARIVGRDPSTRYRWFERYKGRFSQLVGTGLRQGGTSAALLQPVQTAL